MRLQGLNIIEQFLSCTTPSCSIQKLLFKSKAYHYQPSQVENSKKNLNLRKELYKTDATPTVRKLDRGCSTRGCIRTVNRRKCIRQ